MPSKRCIRTVEISDKLIMQQVLSCFQLSWNAIHTLFAWLLSQPASSVFFSNQISTSHQPQLAVFSSHNKSAPATSHSQLNIAHAHKAMRQKL